MLVWSGVLFVTCLFGLIMVTPTYEATNLVLIQNNYKQQLGMFDDLSTPGMLNPRVNWANNAIKVAHSYALAEQIVDEFGFPERLRLRREEPEEFRDKFKMGLVGAVEAPFTKMREMGLLDEEDPTDYRADALDEFVEDTADMQLVEDTEVISITINEQSPELANQVADRITELLVARMRELEDERTDKALSLAEQALIKSDARYKGALAAMDAFSVEHQVADYNEEKRLRLLARENAQTALQDVDVDLSDLQASIAWVAQQMADPKLIPANYRQLTAQRDELDMQAAALAARQAQLVGSLAASAADLAGLISRESAYRVLEEEVTAVRAIYSQVRAQRDELLVHKATHIGEFSMKLIDSVRVSAYADPDWPSLVLLVPVILIFSLLAAVMMAFLMEVFAGDYVRGARSLSELSGLEVVGVAPRWRLN